MTQQISIGEQIITALCEKLPDGDNVLRVYRSTVQAFQAKVLPVCAIRPRGETITRDSHQQGRERTLTLELRYIMGRDWPDESEALDRMSDSAKCWLEQTITNDPSLEGLCRDVQVTEWGWLYEPGEEDFVGLLGTVMIIFDTTNDPTEADVAESDIGDLEHA